ncbi:MAG: hypothetical protein F8N39_01575 [Clostridiaceae bacterium]|nr:hypothetical protein [Clostridiaceae bacterium]
MKSNYSRKSKYIIIRKIKGVNMSELGSLSVKIWQETEFIEELNDALLVIDAELIGKRSYFNFSDDDFFKSLNFILSFVDKLNSTITNESIHSELCPIITKIEESNKPKEDWLDDLNNLSDVIN